MDKKFAIFDMDGTLVDSMPKWQNLAAELLHSKGVKSISKEVLETIKTMTLTESSEYFIHHFGFSGTASELVDEMRSIMKTHYEQDVELKPGVKNYLKDLKEKGVKMCVASATPEPLIELCLRRLNVLDFFEFSLSCDTVKAGKSRPTVYLKAMEKLDKDIDTKDVAVYEDSYFAANTARNANFYVVGVYDECGDTQWEMMKKLANEVIYF